VVAPELGSCKSRPVRIIAKRTLSAFWKRHPKAKGPLEAWHQEVARADRATPLSLKSQFRSASLLQNNRVVFNIAGNHYRYPPNQVEAIKFRMDQLGMTRKDLEAMLGGRERVSEILIKKRGLSLEMIRRLHRELQIPLESLVGSAA